MRLTLRELKKWLDENYSEKYAEFELVTEGCDCYGDVGEVEVDHKNHQIMFCRENP